MAKEILQNGESFGSIRSKINGNFSELYSNQGGSGTSENQLKELYLKDVFDPRMEQNILISTSSNAFATPYDVPASGRYAVSVVVPVKEGEKYLIDRSSVVGDFFRVAFADTYEITDYQEPMTDIIRFDENELLNTGIVTVPLKARLMVINLVYQEDNWDISGLKVFKSQAAKVKEPQLIGTFSDVFLNQKTLPDLIADDLAGSMPDDIHGEYDALMAEFPNVVSKRFISNHTDYDGSENTDYSVYEYTFQAPECTPTELSYDNAYLEKPVTILITTGLHGNEKLSVWAVLEFMRQMLQNWQDDPLLASIRANITFKIIPVANPGGYRFDSRYLRDDVDPNRVWFEGQTTNYYEIEAIRAWLEENKDAYMFIDYHLAAHPWFKAYNKEYVKIFSSMIRRLSLYWRDKYHPTADYNYTSAVARDTTTQGTLTQYVYNVVGIEKTMLLECEPGGNVAGDVRHEDEWAQKTLELIINLIGGMLHNYHRN